MAAMLVQASMCDQRPGLGNRLFSWARAEVFGSRTGARMIAPMWSQIKIGPMLRRETDLRYYLNLFDNSGYVRGPARWHALAARPRIVGEEANRMLDEIGPEALAGELSGRVVDFRGYEGWFRDDLMHHRDVVSARLDAITSKAVKREIAAFDKPAEIVCHVRRGDMRTLAPGEGFKGNELAVESEVYFIAVIEQLRGELGDLPVTIFSNSRPGELVEIPKLAGVHFASVKHSALTDIWLMSRATVFVGSSQSSFSAWASYLGGMPTVWHAPKRIQLVPEHPEYAIEIGTDARISDDAIDVVKRYSNQRS